MNLINEKVTHKKFGTGNIEKLQGTSLEIRFTSGAKTFVYPDAFEKFLAFENTETAATFEATMQLKQQDMNEKRQQLEEETQARRAERQQKLTYEKLLTTYKVHPQSQVVFRCDAQEQQSVFEQWEIAMSTIKSGDNKGKPSKLVRVYPNSAVLLTALSKGEPEKNRRIIGMYMVPETYIGKLSDAMTLPAHEQYRIQLTDEESHNMLFWKYYANEKNADKVMWNSGRHRYFDNEWMAQILTDIARSSSSAQQKTAAEAFLQQFKKLNNLIGVTLSGPQGALQQ